MKDYFRNLVFCLLTSVEGVLNFFCALVRYYPKISWSTSYLAEVEYKKIQEFIYERDLNTKRMQEESSQMVNKVRENIPEEYLRKGLTNE